MKQLKLTIGTTHVKVCLNADTPRPVFWDLEKFGDKKLRLWEKDFRTKKWQPTTRFFEILPNREGITIPITFLEDIKIWLGEHGLSYDEVPEENYDTLPMDVAISDGWVARDYQQEAVDYLTNIDIPRHGLSAQTGVGKSAMAIFTVVKMNMVTLIVVPGLVKQWQENILEQTNIDPKDVWILQEWKSINKLWKSDIKPKVFIASVSTMRAYLLRKGKYHDLPTYDQLIKEYGVGVKISDEAHKHFATNVMLDLGANIKHNIYLTATFADGNAQRRRIFNKVYPEGMRYNPKEYDSYVNITEYGFMGSVPTNRSNTARGYSHTRYEQHLLKCPTLFADWVARVLLPVFDAHYTNKDIPEHGKCLIFCSTIDFINKVVEVIRLHAPNRKVMSYVTGAPDSVLSDAHVIVSTFGSCGTGKDLKELYTVLNTVSFKAPTLTLQVIGRLRKLDNHEPDYCEMFDINIPACMRHWAERARVYKRIGKTYKEFKIR